MYKLFVLCSLFVLSTICSVSAQDTLIYLKNPSFEDAPQPGRTPTGWINCSDDPALAPDIQPSGEFGVTVAAQHGKTYLALVVRDNETWEKVSQKLSRSLTGGKCYEFKIFLARSAQYIGQSEAKAVQANFITPVKLKIYGGFSPCDRQFLLAESNLIIHYRWLEYNFRFEPIDDYSHITFEAFYKTPNLFPYNGNILLDGASAITPVECEEKPEVVNKPVLTPVQDDFSKRTSDTLTNLKPQPQPPVLVNPDLNTLKSKDLQQGQTLRMSSINFAVNDTLINQASFANLNELVNFLNTNSGIVIEIGGHTNGLCADEYCNSLSLRRASAVARYLVYKGIRKERLVVKGYGKTQPISAVKNDSRNQRVDIKILDLNVNKR